METRILRTGTIVIRVPERQYEVVRQEWWVPKLTPDGVPIAELLPMWRTRYRSVSKATGFKRGMPTALRVYPSEEAAIEAVTLAAERWVARRHARLQAIVDSM